MSTHTCRKLVIALALLAALALPCHAASKLLKGDYSHTILRLESFQPVTTWEHDGVKVFVSTEGGMVRQGDVRLTAPRMVVWFEKADSEKARKAIVRVYAESTPAAHGHPAASVELVEKDAAHTYAAALMTLHQHVFLRGRLPADAVREARPQRPAGQGRAAGEGDGRADVDRGAAGPALGAIRQRGPGPEGRPRRGLLGPVDGRLHGRRARRVQQPRRAGRTTPCSGTTRSPRTSRSTPRAT